jgi:hypothetical protein
MCLAWISAARRVLQFGHLEAGFHFVPEGHTIVAQPGDLYVFSGSIVLVLVLVLG